MSWVCCFRISSSSQEKQDLSLIESLSEEIWVRVVSNMPEPWRMRPVSRGIKTRVDGTYFPIHHSDGHMIWLLLRPWATLFEKTGKGLRLCTTIKKEPLSGGEVEEVEVIHISTIFAFPKQIRFLFFYEGFDALWRKPPLRRSSLEL